MLNQITILVIICSAQGQLSSFIIELPSQTGVRSALCRYSWVFCHAAGINQPTPIGKVISICNGMNITISCRTILHINNDISFQRKCCSIMEICQTFRQDDGARSSTAFHIKQSVFFRKIWQACDALFQDDLSYIISIRSRQPRQCFTACLIILNCTCSGECKGLFCWIVCPCDRRAFCTAITRINSLCFFCCGSCFFRKNRNRSNLCKCQCQGQDSSHTFHRLFHNTYLLNMSHFHEKLLFIISNSNSSLKMHFLL